MKLEQSFEIAAPLDEVFDALIDLERVAPCLPGAAITGRDDEGAYRGTIVIKLGPTTAPYNGTITIDAIDREAYTATLNARGTDKRGQGGATAIIVNRLSDVDGRTRVDAETDMNITGRLARFGRPGMVQDISNRMLKEFASCLQERLASGADEPTASDVAAPPAPASGPGAPTPDPVAQESVGGDRAPDISADLAAEGREAANVTPMAATPTGAPTGMAGGALAGAPATDPEEGVAGTRADTPSGSAGGGSAGGGAPSPAPQFEAAPPVEGLSLMAGVLGDQVKRNAAPLAALVALLVLLLLRSRR